MLCPLMRVWKGFRIQVSSLLHGRGRNFCILCVLFVATNLRRSVVLLEESFKPSTDLNSGFSIDFNLCHFRWLRNYFFF